MAASQCPKCSHLFEVRDGFGELLPLSFCSSCQSYYPAQRGVVQVVRHRARAGSEAAPVDAHRRRWTHRDGVARRRAAARSQRENPTRAARRNLERGRTRRARLTTACSRSWRSRRPTRSVRARRPTHSSARDTIAAWTNIDAPAPAAEVPTAVAPEQRVVQSGTRVIATGTRVATPTAYPPAPVAYPAAPIVSRTSPFTSVPKSRASSRWVNLVAKNWIIVRTSASQDAHIVASVGPESRVQLGEVRGSWRRLRSRDILGWVDLRRATFAEARGSSRTSGLASRY